MPTWLLLATLTSVCWALDYSIGERYVDSNIVATSTPTPTTVAATTTVAAITTPALALDRIVHTSDVCNHTPVAVWLLCLLHQTVGEGASDNTGVLVCQCHSHDGRCSGLVENAGRYDNDTEIRLTSNVHADRTIGASDWHLLIQARHLTRKCSNSQCHRVSVSVVDLGVERCVWWQPIDQHAAYWRGTVGVCWNSADIHSRDNGQVGASCVDACLLVGWLVGWLAVYRWRWLLIVSGTSGSSKTLLDR
jgi:hypothetical protein